MPVEDASSAGFLRLSTTWIGVSTTLSTTWSLGGARFGMVGRYRVVLSRNRISAVGSSLVGLEGHQVLLRTPGNRVIGWPIVVAGGCARPPCMTDVSSSEPRGIMSKEAAVSRKNLFTAHLGTGRRIVQVESKEVTMGLGVPAPLHVHPCEVVGVVTQGNIAY